MNPETNFIRLRGLPFAAKESDVRNFLQGITAKSITFTLTSSGRASGECYVELNDNSAVKEALKLDRNEINGRYIEVRLRGLPYSANVDDIKEFFKGTRSRVVVRNRS
uniref:RRM domain-containing protein n=1 Tax=Parascaris equorum TaxID=6256 RepID=A0A914SDJ2_PAREQ